ncbi:penicillin-binding protein 1A [Billgrantia desiderata]|uniref:Penicillin-binding protein 1A n=1 Tax=Billgrantia desiderata TaxID=52021 RepID=A0AAW4YQC1_9GAMM|nr:penicillin-binding protein 1A [Halomonas desiderata]MCE8011106.1 penicillin-binding protein 1A [Halomonas desiderata]MCE8030197.1 penicillin-binding protein 1A [Halomonas desiderata]MCE8042702.1 penicillin-binding protein 1A [Halomonas desiderata]MCE8047277.1 penicillin-binding protein 1A [Halomonas desiderata]MCE8050584.1 penicillin-binding protein 1A [Halomonas desiderata]
MKWIKTLVFSAFWLLVSLTAAALLSVAGAALYFAPGLPDVRQLQDFELHTPLRVFTRDGKLIGEFGEERRMAVSFDEIPEDFIQALLAAEDAAFFEHRGVDPRGLARAAVELVSSGGDIQSGGSTITMQVARNYLLTLDRTFTRKIREILLALQMERILTKEEILELYVNKIFLGNRAYGIAAAAEVYYNKPLEELTLAEKAMIAGLPKAPSSFNPLANPERSLIRRNWILYRMRQLGNIDQATYEAAVQEPVTARRHVAQIEVDADYVAEMARQYAVERFGEEAYTGGYRIHTTLDSQLQPYARQALARGLIDYDTRHGWRGPEEREIPSSLAEAQARTERRGLEEELAESPEIMQTARQAAERSQTRVEGIEGDVSNWLRVLERTPGFGPLQPAIVVASEGREMRVLTRGGELVTLNWDGLSWARAYRSPRARGPEPSSASEIASRGDLVRILQRDNGSWRLSQRPDAEGSIVVMEPDTGAILALQGGFSFNASKFNRAVQAQRQSGSIFKPFVFLAALDTGLMTASTVVNDAPVVMHDGSSLWRPVNSSGDFLGPTRLREALARSRNLVTIRILQTLGLDSTIEYLEGFGFSRSRLPHGLSLALGSADLTPLEMTNAYAVLANGGHRVSPWFIERVTRGSDDNVLDEARPAIACRSCDAGQTEVVIDGRTYDVAPRVADPTAVYILRDMLRDVIESGTGRAALSLNRNDVVGKTGTTNNQRDGWFAGYNDDLVVTVWIGKDNNESIAEYGGNAALPIWIDFMGNALNGRPEARPEPPAGLITARVDAQTGRRLADGQPGGITEIFHPDYLPDMEPRRVEQEIEQRSGSQGTGSYEAIF